MPKQWASLLLGGEWDGENGHFVFSSDEISKINKFGISNTGLWTDSWPLFC
jgi:hypothetical protein